MIELPEEILQTERELIRNILPVWIKEFDEMGRKRKIIGNPSAQHAREAQESGEVDEDFRINLDKIFTDFQNHPLLESYQFPPLLTKASRAYIHNKCVKMGLKSKSVGREPNRQITIYKKKLNRQLEVFDVELSQETHHLLELFKSKYKRNTNKNYCKKMKVYNVMIDSPGKLFMWPMEHVPKQHQNPLLEFRRTLPIFKNKATILEAIEQHSVIIISAETGSGKTTQIPQYLLEDANEKNKKVKIICTQPRRLSTIAIAERVASERGELIGNTVGYQIKLESKLGAKTSLIYCTNGVLLRMLMGGNDCFNNVTHILVDEIHERDKFTDFLLICLREAVGSYPHLKIILMSATMEMDIFINYFKSVHVIKVDGRSHQITSWFLDDIMLQIGYENEGMRQLREMREKNGSFVAKNAVVHRKQQNTTVPNATIIEEIDDAINACFVEGSENEFTNLMQLLLEQNVDVNYHESDSQKTPLMAAARHGNLTVLEQLLNMGADPFLSDVNGLTASGWAQQYGKTDVADLLAMYNTVTNDQSNEVVQILKDYDRTIGDDSTVDFELIVSVIKYIHNHMDKQGAILVFLPGYDDIMFCNEAIVQSNLNQNAYKIFMLHGSMQMGSQHQVFNKLPNKQKIILSTNIAETSITIDDVVFVIDTGKAKEKTYDLVSGISALKTQWISMASARQRAGRAGRTQNGYCLHLYSYKRYESFSVNKIPEILRVPLHELCLQTKMLAPTGTSIEGFISLAIDPPSNAAVTSSIGSLKNLGALDKFENLTTLGTHLLHLSLDPNLGKMLIYAVIFKCLDPVLTIVACLAHKDPFNMPTKGHLKNTALEKRKALSEDSMSDHLAMIRIFQMWQDAKVTNNIYRFCSDNFVSNATMDSILLSRSHLLSQLRAVGFVRSNPKDSINELNMHSDCWPLVKACITAGLYPNVAFYYNGKLQTRIEKHVHLGGFSAARHPENDITLSCSKSHNCWIIYEELSKLQYRCAIRCATVITPLTIALVGGLECELSEEGSVILDDWFEFNFENQDVPQLRAAIDEIVEKKISAPRSDVNHGEEELISIFVKILLAEDRKYGLASPLGIGSKPRLLHNRPNSYDTNRYGNHNKASTSSYNNRSWTSTQPWLHNRQDHNDQNRFRRDFNNVQDYRHNQNRFHQNEPEYNNSHEYRNTHIRFNQHDHEHQEFKRNTHIRLNENDLDHQEFKQNQGRYHQNEEYNNSQDFRYNPNRSHQNEEHSNFRHNQNRLGEYNQPDYRNRFQHDDQQGRSNEGFGGPKSFGHNEEFVKYPQLFPPKGLYFLIRPQDGRQITLSMQTNSWLFPSHLERKLSKLFLDHFSVILIFSVRNTSQFNGVAKLQGVNIGSNGRPCPITWITRSIVSFYDVKNIINPRFNSYEDGEQIDSNVGRKLSERIYDWRGKFEGRPILGKRT